MKHPITLPVLSDTMQTGRLTRWNKAAGDPVHKGDAVAEVETDKAILDVEAFSDGYLAGPLAPVDQDIPVGQIIGYLVDDQDEAQIAPDLAMATPAGSSIPEPNTRQSPPMAAPKPGDTVPTGPQGAAPVSSSEPTPASLSPVFEEPTRFPATPPASGTGTAFSASPYARALAHDLGLSFEAIPAGPDHHIHARDVVAAALAPPDADLSLGPPYELIKPSSLRAAVARNMSAASRAPIFQIGGRFNLDPLHRRSKQQSIHFTLALSRACALTVAEDPWFNHTWTREGIAKRQRVDIGIAVDTVAGLITPVLRDAAVRPMQELAEDWRILLDKVKSGRITPENYQGATFYLSNLGIFPEVEQFHAIVPAGAAAILAVAAPGADGRTNLTLSCDHRIIFGADAARFLARLAKRLEDPSWLS